MGCIGQLNRGLERSTEIKGIKHLLIAPPLAFLVCISVVPLIFTLVLSLTNYSIGGRLGWVGFDNYLRLLNDLFFVKSYVNTFLYVFLGVVIQYWVGLGLALLVNSLTTGKRLMRLLILLPFMMPPLIVGFVWKTMFDSRYGPLSALTRILHVGPILWLNDPALAFTSIVIVDTWQWTPFMFLILFAGLRILPKEPFEAARVDGASDWRIFWDLTFPMLIPASIGAILLRSIEAFKLFDIVFYITGGGPGGATSTATLQGYFTALRSGNLGYGAAMSIVLFLTVVVLSSVALLLVRSVHFRKPMLGRRALERTARIAATPTGGKL
jgi:multiple sugar transport system permease protein